MRAGSLLHLKRPERVAEELERRFGGEVRTLETLVQRAATGDVGAARDYVTCWRGLATGVLQAVRQERPDVVAEGPGGELRLVDIKGDPVEITIERLQAVSVTAPYSTWVARVGLGRGMALRLLAEVRESVPGAVPLVPPTGLCVHWGSGKSMLTALVLLERAVAEAAQAQDPPTRGAGLLKRAGELFGLDRPQLAKLFGVRRQAVEQWQRRGVPAERQAKLATIVATGEFLERRLRAELLPGVARRPAAAYQGSTMLQMIEADKHEELLRSVRASFDWAATA